MGKNKIFRPVAVATMAFFFLVLAVFPAAGCAKASKSMQSGIQGVVMIGPVSPVEKEGEVNEKPYPDAQIWVFNTAGDQKVTAFTSDQDGKFKIDLAPGVYLLEPRSPENSLLPIGDKQTIEVRADVYTQVIIRYDSGIR